MKPSQLRRAAVTQMNISEAAEKSGLPVKTIRYYEEIGLVVPDRRDNGYRHYTGPELNKLAFLQRARRLGFSIGDCRALLSLYEDKNRASADVRRVAEAHILEVDQKIAELRALRDTLGKLVESCRGDDRADCPILDDLAGRF